MSKENKKEKKGKANINEAGRYTKGFFKGFKNFITRGNVLDLAVGVVIGGAFGAITTALVNGIIMPVVAIFVPSGGMDGIVTVLNPAKASVTSETVNTITYWGTVYDADIVNVINWGTFLNAILNFLIIAFVIYLIVNVLIKRQLSRDIAAEDKAKKEAEEAEAQKLIDEENAKNAIPVIPEDIKLLTEIRDQLLNLNNNASLIGEGAADSDKEKK